MGECVTAGVRVLMIAAAAAAAAAAGDGDGDGMVRSRTTLCISHLIRRSSF